MDIEEDIFLTWIQSSTWMIINELISNSLKHAFSGRNRGKIKIKLHKEYVGKCMKEGDIDGDKSTTFVLSISDNWIGISEDFDIGDIDSLGLQLVTSLVDQIDGELELKSNSGTEFTIRFTVTEKSGDVPQYQKFH